MTIVQPDMWDAAAIWANAYRSEFNLAVIPAGRNKHPVETWKEFQDGIPLAVHERWYGVEGRNSNDFCMGFITGGASLENGWKLLVVDCDLKEQMSGIETLDRWYGEYEMGRPIETWTATSGSGGRHIYFRYPDTLSVRTTKYPNIGVDIRADGGFIMAPPSPHQIKGKTYQWDLSPFDTELGEAPAWLLDILETEQAGRASSGQARSDNNAVIGEKDAFGNDIDGREAKMTRMVWAAAVSRRRESPVKPDEAESEALMAEVFQRYAERTRPKVKGRMLEDEGRGLTAFRDKWQRAMKQWDTKVALHAVEEPVSGEKAEEAEAKPVFASDIEPFDLGGRFKVPELPAGVLPMVIEHYARSQARSMGTDPAGLAVAALTVCGAAIPDGVRLRVKPNGQWYESARIWTGLIGPPSTKKSPTIAAAVAPLARLDTAMMREYQRARKAWEALDKEEKKTTEPPKKTRLRLSDTTIEAAQEILNDSPDGVLMALDELGGWFGAMEKYSGNRGSAKDRAFWLQSFNGGQYAVNRIGRGDLLIANLSVSLLGGIQPDVIRWIAAEKVDDGLLQRMLLIILAPASLGSDEAPSSAVERYHDLIERLHRTVDGVASFGSASHHREIVLYFSDGAQAIRRALEQRHLELMAIESINRKLAAHFGKYDGLFARLCVIWHCIEHSTGGVLLNEIAAATAQRAADFLHKFLLPHAIAFYMNILGFADNHELLVNVTGYILARRLEVITMREFQRGSRTMRAMDRPEIVRAMGQLEALGWAEPGPSPKNSTRPRWLVNPRVHERFADRAEQERRARDATRETLIAIFGGVLDD